MDIHAFCDEEFLIRLSEASTIDLVENETFHEQISKVKLFDLLRNGVKINCHIQNTDNINPFILSLMKKATSTTLDEKDFICFKENPAEFIKRKGRNNSLFLLGNDEANNLKILENNFGYHCINFNHYSSIFEESIHLFKRNFERTNWKIATEYLQPHNSLLVVDPYLLTRTGFPPFLDFLGAILPKKLKNKYHLSIIGNKKIPISGININEAKETLYNLLSNTMNDFRLEIHLFDFVPKGEDRYSFDNPSPQDFHDRYLISNNACIFSGRGLDYIRDYQMNFEGTWIVFKPFSKISMEKESAFFTKVIEKKMKGFKQWVMKSDTPNSNNPLIQCYKN